MENCYSRYSCGSAAEIKFSQRGFSLVELMVVVAIIGVLAATAVPSIRNYIVRARQTEAKTNLSALYSANKVFQTTYGIFENQFTVIGFRPEGRMRYNIGWNALPVRTLAQLQGYGYDGSVVDVAQNSRIYCGLGIANCVATIDMAATPDDALCNSSLNGGTSFLVCASGRILNNAIYDGWSLDDKKLFTNTQDGTQ